ncbi:hypothetical protein DPEC_G00137300 [Dallia pectoralis]|uniref:Uncharacterized protein n=1 Tax=Dallia pectoralis TaxID=75939 RepID=A0ACC2GLX2_DALPE|nr:hypothetical protein DPEC_G00137300 [Dallia pectoralis]
MKKFRKVLDGLSSASSPGGVASPSCGSAAGTPTAHAPTPLDIHVQETLVSENFHLCKSGTKASGRGLSVSSPSLVGLPARSCVGDEMTSQTGTLHTFHVRRASFQSLMTNHSVACQKCWSGMLQGITVRHGFPYQPTCLAFDPVQKILAIGSRTGGIRMYPFPISHMFS